MNEVFIVGALLLILMAAAAFFLYSRLLYAERKIGLIESILLDIKMSMEMEEEVRPVMPAKEAPVFAPVEEASPSAEAPTTEADIAYYSSVIESAVEAPVAEVAEPVAQEPIPAAQLNYDAYTRDELAAIAEKRGLRVTKRMSKGAIADLLRGSEQTSSAAPVAGDEQPVGAAGGATGGAPLDNGPLEEVELSV